MNNSCHNTGTHNECRQGKIQYCKPDDHNETVLAITCEILLRYYWNKLIPGSDGAIGSGHVRNMDQLKLYDSQHNRNQSDHPTATSPISQQRAPSNIPSTNK